MTLIIGLGNKARHGKDTAAQAIVNYYGYQRDTQKVHGLPVSAPFAVRIGFADALYEVCRKEYGMTEKDAPLLQRIGAERRTTHGKDYWVKQVFDQIKPYHDIVVIPDVRYMNEAWYIKECGGWLINFTRLNAAGNVYIDPSRDPSHPSEVDLDGWNWDFKYIISDGHQALTGELAITTAEYLRNLHK